MRSAFIVYGFLLAANAASACPGQQGKVIFEDDFSDDSGGWQGAAPDIVFKDGTLQVHPNPRGEKEEVPSLTVPQMTFHARDADYCVELILPKSPAPDNLITGGMKFWQSGDNTYSFRLISDGRVQLQKRDAGTWTQVYVQKVDNVSDSANSLRVLAKDNKITMFVNDKQIKVIRAQPFDGPLSFGLTTSADKPSSADPIVVFKSFKVTTGP